MFLKHLCLIQTTRNPFKPFPIPTMFLHQPSTVFATNHPLSRLTALLHPFFAYFCLFFTISINFKLFYPFFKSISNPTTYLYPFPIIFTTYCPFFNLLLVFTYFHPPPSTLCHVWIGPPHVWVTWQILGRRACESTQMEEALRTNSHQPRHASRISMIPWQGDLVSNNGH